MQIIARFGGPAALLHALFRVGQPRCSVQNWTWERPHGTGGLIPAIAVDAVIRAAAWAGVILPPEIWDPQGTLDREQ